VTMQKVKMSRRTGPRANPARYYPDEFDEGTNTLLEAQSIYIQANLHLTRIC
jgi:hypothetical protein